MEQIRCWTRNQKTHFFTKLPVVLSCSLTVPFLLFIPNLLPNIQYVQNISNVQGNPLQLAPSDGSPFCIHFSLQYLPFQSVISLESCVLLVILTNTMKISGEYNKIQPIFEIRCLYSKYARNHGKPENEMKALSHEEGPW